MGDPKLATKTRKTSPDAYLELIRRFPLKPIKTDREHEEAVGLIGELMGTQDSGEGDYLDTLIVLVNKYEQENHAIDEKMTPREALATLMEINGLHQAEIGKIIGSESAVSMFLGGTRGLSKAQIKKLADRFKVNGMVFME